MQLRIWHRHLSPLAGAVVAAGGLVAVASQPAQAVPPVPDTNCATAPTGQNCATVTGTVSTTTPLIDGKRYIVHQWTAGSGTFVPNQQMNVEYLVVGGGGGSGAIGNNGGGGGGGGGQVTQNVGTPAAANGTSSVSITVGGGGAGGSTTGITRGTTGTTSSAAFGGGIGTISAAGGAGGGSSSTTAGLSGVNGGGGGGGSGTTGATSGGTGTAFNGGGGWNNSVNIAFRGGGGGAGAGEAGVAAVFGTFVTAGNGGAGTSSTILTGSGVTYAGGGGGGVSNQNANNVAGSGGSGGGGGGGRGTTGVAGTANTGGGAGGPGGNNTTSQAGSTGGSGVVAIRYLAFNQPAAPTGVTVVPGNGSARVAWTAPTDTGGASLTGYTATTSPGGLNCTVSAPTSTCDITGLTNDTGYTFTVTATNAADLTSADSSPAASTTPRRLAPAPSSATITDGSPAVLGWTAPTYISTGGYVVQYRRPGGTTWYVYASKGATTSSVWPVGTAPTSINLNATVGNCGTANIAAGWTNCPLKIGAAQPGDQFRIQPQNNTGSVSAAASNTVTWNAS